MCFQPSARQCQARTSPPPRRTSQALSRRWRHRRRATNIVEHTELVAQRLTRLVHIVGRENVTAGTDCGFAQSPFAKRVHESIMWAKLRVLAEGARLASAELWGKRSAA
jgi:hypothetical protein